MELTCWHLFPNRTWKQATSDEYGAATVDLHTTHFPMTVFAAKDGFAARVEHRWTPADRALTMELEALPGGGSVIFPEATGSLPGLKGRLNPILDTHDRTYLYASNIAINEGRQQPVHFIFGEELRLTDADGKEMLVRFIEIVGRSVLVEYRQCPAVAESRRVFDRARVSAQRKIDNETKDAIHHHR